jgi:hypothetical protein
VAAAVVEVALIVVAEVIVLESLAAVVELLLNI